MGLVGIFPEIQLGGLFAPPRRHKNAPCLPLRIKLRGIPQEFWICREK